MVASSFVFVGSRPRDAGSETTVTRGLWKEGAGGRQGRRHATERVGAAPPHARKIRGDTATVRGGEARARLTMDCGAAGDRLADREEKA